MPSWHLSDKDIQNCVYYYGEVLSLLSPLRRPMMGALDVRSFMEETMRVLILFVFLLQLAVILKTNW